MGSALCVLSALSDLAHSTAPHNVHHTYAMHKGTCVCVCAYGVLVRTVVCDTFVRHMLFSIDLRSSAVVHMERGGRGTKRTV